jgi:hypothetical protein
MIVYAAIIGSAITYIPMALLPPIGVFIAFVCGLGWGPMQPLLTTIVWDLDSIASTRSHASAGRDEEQSMSAGAALLPLRIVARRWGRWDEHHPYRCSGAVILRR